MEKMFLGAIGLLTILLIIIVNFFDVCKNCGASRGRSSVTYCRHCHEEFVPKYLYARKMSYVAAGALIVLFLIYKGLYD